MASGGLDMLSLGFRPASLDERKTLLSVYSSLDHHPFNMTGTPYVLSRRSTEIFDALAGPYLRDCAKRAFKAFPRCLAFDVVGSDSDDEDEVKPSELGQGEDISYEEFQAYLEELRGRVHCVDDLLQLEDESQIVEMCERHALYRIRAYELLRGKSIEELDDDTLKRKFTPRCLEKEDYFECFEIDGTFGWSFHPDHCGLAALDDYQRLVPLNEGGNEYLEWDQYRLFYHTYQLDLEYLKYCEEISGKLKWIEDYACLPISCPEWIKMSNRGAYQAIKIAASFPNITRTLAYLGYQEYVFSMRRHVLRHEELDCISFEIWERLAKQETFADTLKEVPELNTFPLRQSIIEYMFHKHDYSDMEEQVAQGKARKLIARALQKKFQKPVGPKTFEQYIRKKLKIAEYIGLME